ncbi:MAG: CRISPR-associated endonuclease Cas2 [Candidatus Cloacimonetes bacterium]|jgi:CRISPR-associated protein Cas2|nr:CRISPR-associated endonuclease Cas2 [Candidatus Cloacimonadota bacterium]MCK9185803.1 CRISPR-associated endonuclease Cas2 [Candidatus Cloacimonadota bacterium]MCK9583993.1 CRISPR-associated endonuclease Cas2 [Candidatus Cloacimonadota bacterium]MDD2229713.1 CRISPR-associated endonuclease Cas2 [Candidatus Cloacimonadota bacterium]
MLTWVMYDIVQDKIRNKIVKCCEKAGIYRVQYSVWLGEMNKTQRKELRTQIEDLIKPDEDKVYIFPMCREDFNSCILLGQAFDRDLVTDEVKALLL